MLICSIKNRNHGSRKKRLMVYLMIAITAIIGLACEESTFDPPAPTPKDSLDQLRTVIANPIECAGCHPNHYDEWQTSMHAYAFEDPVFQKLNNLAQQRSNNTVDQFCLKCHAPIASALGDLPPGFDPAQTGFNTRRGIHCDVCHVANEVPRGLSIKNWHLDRVRRGTIPNPQANTFHQSDFRPDMSFSNFCATCHDIEAPDGTFFLEMTNTEWDNSVFAGMGIECQNCHMPAYQGTAAEGGPQRTVHRHTFVGVDYPLIDFPGKDQMINDVRSLLENSVSLQVEAPTTVTIDSTLEIAVQIKNILTGHNVPSGSTFERQMWIELIVRDVASGDTLLETGTLDPDGDLRDHHSEHVTAGSVPRDSLLVLYRGIPRNANGDELAFFWEADQVEFRTIPAFESRTTTFELMTPAQSSTLQLDVRIRFRAFPPYFLKEIDEAQLIPELLIFDMETFQQTISVTSP